MEKMEQVGHNRSNRPNYCERSCDSNLYADTNEVMTAVARETARGTKMLKTVKRRTLVEASDFQRSPEYVGAKPRISPVELCKNFK